MSRKKKRARAEPKRQIRSAWLCSDAAYETLCCGGYTRLSDNPEVLAAVNKICDLVSSMTIHLMSNTENGDVRIKNALSRKIDIEPHPHLTRKNFISVLVRSMLLTGDGNALAFPVTKSGYLDYIQPIPPSQVSYIPDGYGYTVNILGKEYLPDDVLHFAINPSEDYAWLGTGYRVALRDVTQNLRQAAATTRGFMESKWKPSVIVKVESMSEELANKDGRKKLLEDYVSTTNAGEPWVIPAEQFDVEVVKPLSLNDLAISDAVTLDKKTVASILDIPAFVMGVGEFKETEWNNFINTRIKSICNVIEQEMTKKLLISPDWYFRFNVRSLLSYDIEKLSRVGDDNYTRGIMTGNEVRDWIGLSPMEGLDELVILENYIPQGMIGDQKKLNGGEGTGNSE